MSADHAEHSEEAPHAHDQASEVAHAWHHFHENVRFFACFFSVVLLTVVAWSINFGPTGNKVAVLFFAAARSGLIAYFMASMFKPFSFVFRTFIFSAIFLVAMIFLSLWDSEIGDPIKDRINVPPPPSHVPKFVHQIIVFAGISISLIFAWFCFTDPSAAGDIRYVIAGIGSIGAAIGLVGYGSHFLRRTRRLVIG